MNVVGEDNRSRASVLDDAVANNTRSGPAPIERIHVPQDDFVTEFLVDPFFLMRRNVPIRRSQQGGAGAHRAFDRIIGPAKLAPHSVVRHFIKIRMGPAMVGDFVSFFCFPRDDVGIFGGIFTDQEKGRFNMMSSEQIEQLGRQFRAWTIVEGQGDVRTVDVDPIKRDTGLRLRGCCRLRVILCRRRAFRVSNQT